MKRKATFFVRRPFLFIGTKTGFENEVRHDKGNGRIGLGMAKRLTSKKLEKVEHSEATQDRCYNGSMY
jgi:hypothetical protein